jgi:hypothetical protein
MSEQAARNLYEGRPATENVGQSYVEGAVGTVVPLGGHMVLRGVLNMGKPSETLPEEIEAFLEPTPEAKPTQAPEAPAPRPQNLSDGGSLLAPESQQEARATPEAGEELPAIAKPEAGQAERPKVRHLTIEELRESAIHHPKSDQLPHPTTEGQPEAAPRLSPDEVESIVGAWHFVRETNSRPKPQSLTAFLAAKGGVQDEMGEVSHLTGGTKGRPGLIRANGQTLDDAANAAWEAGFFPDMAERPTVPEFLEKLRDDLHTGQIVRGEDQGYFEDRTVAQEMERDLEDFGITARQFNTEGALRTHLAAQGEPRGGAEAPRRAEAAAGGETRARGESRAQIAAAASIEKQRIIRNTLIEGLRRGLTNEQADQIRGVLEARAPGLAGVFERLIEQQRAGKPLTAGAEEIVAAQMPGFDTLPPVLKDFAKRAETIPSPEEVRAGTEAFSDLFPDLQNIPGEGRVILTDEAEGRYAELRAAVEEAAKQILPKSANLRLVKKIKIPNAPPGVEALGQTDIYNLLISIGLRAVEAEARRKFVRPKEEAVRVLRHEAIEFFKAIGLFDGRDWKLLEKAAKEEGWVDSTGVRPQYTRLLRGMDPERIEQILIKESIAEKFSEFQRGAETFSKPITRIFTRLRDFLTRIGNAVRGLGFQTWEDVFHRVDEGKYARLFNQMHGIKEEAAPVAEQVKPASGPAKAQTLVGGDRAPSTPGLDKPDQSLADIIKTLSQELGVVREGRMDEALKRQMRGMVVKGQYNPNTGVIRLAIQNDLNTLAHEGGHRLESRFGAGLDALKTRHAAELTPLATPGPDALSEGFAEFFRRYLMNRQTAERIAPTFFGDFEYFLGTRDAALLGRLHDMQGAIRDWINAPSAGVIASSVISRKVPGRIASTFREMKEEGLNDFLTMKLRGFYTAVFDKLHPMRIAVDGLLDIANANLGGQLGPGERFSLHSANNPYELLRLARDVYSSGHMNLKYGVHGYHELNPTGPSFYAALDTAFGSNGRWKSDMAERFGAYLVSRRMAQEWTRFANGELANFPDKFRKSEHDENIHELERAHPEFVRAADMIHAFLRGMLKLKRDAGLITDDFYQTLLARTDYVPVMRDMSDREMMGNISTRRPNLKQSIIKRFRGSQRDIINPLESIAKDVYETSALIARNDAIKALDYLARQVGPDGGAIAERIPDKQLKPIQVNIHDALMSAARDAGIDPADAKIMVQSVDDQLGDNAIARVWRSGDINEKGEPIVYFWEDGKRVALRLADGQFGHDMFQAISGLGREYTNVFVNMLALPARLLRLGVTSFLDFIGANFIRDQVATWILSEDFTPFVSGIRGGYEEVTRSDLTRIYNRVAGITGGANVATINEARVKRDILALQNKTGLRRLQMLNPFGSDFWRITEVAETSTRLGIFPNAFKRAKADGLSDWDAAIEAAYAARDVLDFGRGGSKMLAAVRIIPFLNSSLQALDSFMRAGTGKKPNVSTLREAISPYIKRRAGMGLTVVEQKRLPMSAKVWAKMVVVGLFGAALTALYRNDEEYEEISEYVRATHWSFKMFGTWIRIPKPYELAFFSNLFERTFEYTYKDDPTAPGRFVNSLFYILMPPVNAPGLTLGYELAANYDFFHDRPIVPEYMQGLPPELQFNAYTSDFGRWLGRQVNISPAMIDHTITSFFGSWGREALNASKLLNNHGIANPVDYPIARRFTLEVSRGSLSRKTFYDAVGRSNGAFTGAAEGYKFFLKGRDFLGASEYLNTLPDERKAYALLEGKFTDSNAKDRKIHPLNRAQAIVKIENALRREVMLDQFFDPNTVKLPPDLQKRIAIPPAKRVEVLSILSNLQMREMRNALIAIDRPGWAQKTIMPVEPSLEELKAASPKVYQALADRIRKAKLPTYEDSRKLWPQVKERLLDEGDKVISIRDLTAQAQRYFLPY